MSPTDLEPALPAGGLSSFTPEAPLVLVTDYPPDTPGGGAVILRSLLRPEDRARIIWITLTPPSHADAAGRDGPVVVRPGAPLRPGQRRSLFLDSTRHAGRLAHGVRAVARERAAAALWVLMHGAGVAVGARLARAGGWPIHLTVHDDPAFGVALRSRRYLALVPWIERDFAAAMHRAASVDVIGEGMAARYRRRYGVDPVIVHRGIGSAVAEIPPYDRAAEGLRIGVLGNTYVYSQLVVLGRAVARAARRLGVPGRLLVVGRSFGDRLRADLAGQIEVEVTGHVDEAEGIALLRRCFLIYLNYPFPARDLVLRQTSFPTKLSTYVMAARPILMHTPPDSSVAPLATPETAGYVVPWWDLRVADGADRLARSWADLSSDRSFHVEADRLRARYYDLDGNRRTLFTALNALATPARTLQGATHG